MKGKLPNRYEALISEIFASSWEPGAQVVPFTRDQLVRTAAKLDVELPKNLGDVIYSFRYRNPLPDSIVTTQPHGKEWLIETAGRGLYEFRLEPVNRLMPNEHLLCIKLPDATPEIISSHALSDEQALLAKVRYNRLVDVFLGLAAYSLQNHLRTTVKGRGQIEIDEIYVGVDRHGCQYIIPVQAKGGNDQLSVVQTRQDIACCAEKFPALRCRAVSAQFMSDARIALFELCVDEEGIVRIVEERHYRLVPGGQITEADLERYALRGESLPFS